MVRKSSKGLLQFGDQRRSAKQNPAVSPMRDRQKQIRNEVSGLRQRLALL